MASFVFEALNMETLLRRDQRAYACPLIGDKKKGELERTPGAVRRAPRPRVFRPRTVLDDLPEDSIVRDYRLSTEAILALYELISPDLERTNLRGRAVPGIVKLLCCLNYFSTGCFQGSVARGGGVSQSSLSRYLGQVLKAIRKQMCRFISFPKDHDDLHALKQSFREIADFPNVLGAIGCTHIGICAPGYSQESYLNRKGWHSLSVQMVCDSKGQITSLLAAFPGRYHNAFILRQSGLFEAFESGDISDGWLVGDSGYPCLPWLMTPLADAQNPSQVKYNEVLAKTRSVIKRTFGVIKSRFRCLDKSVGVLKYSPAKSADIIVACCVLHNIALAHGVPPPTEPAGEGELEQVDHDEVETPEGTAVRDNVIINYF
uniref:Putative nuclease HARBI1 n=1 Tax=Leptobrachium leishanense TaxID=445787 RepID=A0A8C5PFR3_9ANUR